MDPTVTRIPARNRAASTREDKNPFSRKLRVAAYARVSTEEDEQEQSYEAQIKHFTEFIQSNPEWEFVEMYADEKSGTQAKKRPNFMRMIEDCRAGKIDYLLAKSISRWARNTLDALTYIRELKDLRIPIYFEKEKINTMDQNNEMLLTILSSFAQQESQSISENTKLGIWYRMKEGHGRLNTSKFLGLELGDKPGTYVINPEQAEVARRIYREFLDGYSPAMIAEHLESEGIPTASGSGTWYASTVTRILVNEKYCGDMILQKYYVPDFLTHKTVKNVKEKEKFYVADHHDPIVPREVWSQVQDEVIRRGNLKNDPTKIRFGSTQALIRRLKCPYCNRPLKRVQRGERVEWRCRYQSGEAKSERGSKRSACGCRVVLEEDVHDAIVEAFNLLPEFREELIRTQGALRTGEIKRTTDLLEQTRAAEARMEARLTEADAAGNKDEIEFLRLELAGLEYEEKKLILERADSESVEIQIRFLLELLDEMDGKEIKEREWEPACRKPDEFFRRTRKPTAEGVIVDGDIVAFDNDLVIRYVDEIVVLEDGFEVKFKAGVNVKV